MARIELVMPKMGESIIEATILKWLKQPGDEVQEDETILEIATDKVDSEIPSPVDGVISSIIHHEDETVEVGKVIAIIETDAQSAAVDAPVSEEESSTPEPEQVPYVPEAEGSAGATASAAPPNTSEERDGRFYSPLVRSMADKEGISMAELAQISGSGKEGRVTKHDMLDYLKTRSTQPAAAAQSSPQTATASSSAVTTQKTTKQEQAPATGFQSANGQEEIIEMGRMRKMIAQHMVNSKQTSPHVTSMVEADVTHIVEWRNKVKHDFMEKYNQKLTYTPLLMEAVIKAIRDFPMINISVDGDNIIKKNYINLGMAAALPNGNLIVPVIKNADHLNLVGLTHAVNDLAHRARNSQLKPEEIQGGTYTVTNVGTFGNVMGTPIISQPQVAILAMGAIRKKPAVLETEEGDVIAIRHMMFLSHSYDHRVVDGYLGGSFVRRVADYLEAFDTDRTI